MAYTNIFLTAIASEVARQIAQYLKTSKGLLRVATKRIVPAGEKSAEVWKPGSVTTSTRTAYNPLPTAQMPSLESVTLTPSTEYHANPIALDRVTRTEAIVNIAQEHVPIAASEVLASIDAAAWALVTPANITGGSVGSDDTAADISLLAAAKKKLVHDNKCSDTDNLFAVIGGEEEMAWSPKIIYNTHGEAGAVVQSTGIIPRAYGLGILTDSQRAKSGNTAYNLALHPLAIAVAYRSSIAERGYPMGQFTDPETGITVFTELVTMDEPSNGVGQKLSIFAVADVKLVYPKWACIIKSAVE